MRMKCEILAETITQMIMSKGILIKDEQKKNIKYEGSYRDLKAKYASKEDYKEDFFFKKLRQLIDNDQVYISNK